MTIEFADEHFCLAHVGPMILMNWRGDFREGDLGRIEILHHRLAPDHPDGIIGLSVIEPIQALPGASARRVAAAMMERTGPTTRVVMLVMLDRGYVVAALQSMAIKALSVGGRVPMKIFHDLLPGLSWVSRENSDVPNAAELSVMIARLRELPRTSRPPQSAS